MENLKSQLLQLLEETEQKLYTDKMRLAIAKNNGFSEDKLLREAVTVGEKSIKALLRAYLELSSFISLSELYASKNIRFEHILNRFEPESD